MRRQAATAALLAALALLIAAPAAGAAARFATPTGSGTLCTQAQPCDIVTAVNKAAEFDDVTIGPGTYGPLTDELEDEGKPLSIHGQAGAPRPVIVSRAEYAFALNGVKSSLSDVEIENTQGRYGVFVSGPVQVSIDHVYSHVEAPEAIACYPAGTLTDSVCWSSGPKGIAATLIFALDVEATLRNDTLIASGPGGTAVAADTEVANSMTINLSNSIAHGAGVDVSAHTIGNPASKSIVRADHSNYATVRVVDGGSGSTASVTPAGSGTNQTGAPQFVDAAAGDFHEQFTSTATLDLGENSPLNGETDLGGSTRSLPAHFSCGSPLPPITDIGAYELVPPVPTCLERFPPKTTITKTKVNRKTGKITFTFSPIGASSGFQCRLQKIAHKKKRKHRKEATFSACSPPKAYKHLKPGRYRFEVLALDPAGAPGPTTSAQVRLKAPPRS